MGNRWGNSGNNVRLLFWGAPKSLQMVTAAMILKETLLANKGLSSQSYGFLVVSMVFMYRCENWTMKKAEHPRIDAFELWCGRRLLRVPWTQGDPTSPF